MLQRIKDNEGRVPVHPDKEELKGYIRKRLDEGHLTVNRLAKELGVKACVLYTAFSPGGIISVDLLSRLLYIVDGNECPYQYGRSRMVERIDPSAYLNEHPGISLNEWDQDDWIISDEQGEHRFDKLNHSLPDALAEYDKTRTK